VRQEIERWNRTCGRGHVSHEVTSRHAGGNLKCHCSSLSNELIVLFGEDVVAEANAAEFPFDRGVLCEIQ
jgi:hypothetical protein